MSLRESKRRLISFEGMEGCGKSTQIQRVNEWLEQSGKDVLVVREPGGTPLGEAIRHLLKHDESGIEMCDETELMLFAASRAELTRKKIIPHLEMGGWVLCDRFLDSTTIYQGRARGLNTDVVQQINRFAIKDTYPGLTLVLDLPLERAFERMAARKQADDPRDRMEEQSMDFFQTVSDSYRELAIQDPERVSLINADDTPDQVFSIIQKTISHAFHGELDPR
ncbi:MAG: dTMP kinase [Verrucomicrobiota bacterium]